MKNLPKIDYFPSPQWLKYWMIFHTQGPHSEDWEDEDLQERMFKLAVNEGDDPSDEDWLPYELKKKKKPKIGQFP